MALTTRCSPSRPTHRRIWSFPLSIRESRSLDNKIVMIRAGGKNTFYEVHMKHCLGAGSQGSVYMAREYPFVRGNQSWDKAIKFMDMKNSMSTRLSYHTECRILRTLQHHGMHPNIVQYMSRGMISRYVGVIVMERLPDMTLTTYIEARGMVAVEALDVMYQLAKAVHYLHECNVSPRDIKPDNISVDSETLEVKLFDFGLALDVSRPYGRQTSAHTGTQYFMAPEVLHGMKHDTFLADMWCLGQVLYYMLSGVKMFGFCETTTELKDQNHPDHKESHYLNKDEFLFDTSADENCFMIMGALCHPDPAERWKSRKLVSYLQHIQEGSPRDKN